MTDFDESLDSTHPTASTDAGPAPRRETPEAPTDQVSMITLYHHPFCPHSRFVRIALGEYGLDTRLAEAYPAYDAAMKAAGVTHEGYIYPGAVHGFNNDATPERYNKAAADLAWQRTIDWFNKYVRGTGGTN